MHSGITIQIPGGVQGSEGQYEEGRKEGQCEEVGGGPEGACLSKVRVFSIWNTCK